MLEKYDTLTPLLRAKVVEKLAVGGRPEGEEAAGQAGRVAAGVPMPSAVPGTC